MFPMSVYPKMTHFTDNTDDRDKDFITRSIEYI